MSTLAGRPHPLDPLSEAEVRRAAAACRAHAVALGLPPLRFNTIALQEPPKQQLLQYEAGHLQQLPRLSLCILQTPPEFVVYEATVDLMPRRSDAAAATVVSWTKLDGSQLDGQPLATPDDCLEAEAIARGDPRVQAMVAERGVALDKVACDPWAIHACPPEWQGRRLMQVFMYYKACPDDNEYAHPMDLCPVVDLNEQRVTHIDAYDTPPQIPMQAANYHRALLTKPFRQAAKPWKVIQPEGPSFEVSGWQVHWQQWDLRLSFNGREGLVLHSVGYRDTDQGGRRRPVVHRASIAEMAVPYADPRTPYNRKCAFDAGDYGLGFAANSLQLGCDCLGEVAYFDGVVNDSAGEPVVIKNAVCLHEEDHGLSWKHVDYRTGYAEVRRGRRLVLSFIMTAVNYEYCFYWFLHQVKHERNKLGLHRSSRDNPAHLSWTATDEERRLALADEWRVKLYAERLSGGESRLRSALPASMGIHDVWCHGFECDITHPPASSSVQDSVASAPGSSACSGSGGAAVINLAAEGLQAAAGAPSLPVPEAARAVGTVQTLQVNVASDDDQLVMSFLFEVPLYLAISSSKLGTLCFVDSVMAALGFANRMAALAFFCTHAGDYTESKRPPVAQAISKPTDLDAYNALESAHPDGLLPAILQLPDVAERLAVATPEDASDKTNAIVYALLQLLVLPPTQRPPCLKDYVLTAQDKDVIASTSCLPMLIAREQLAAATPQQLAALQANTLAIDIAGNGRLYSANMQDISGPMPQLADGGLALLSTLTDRTALEALVIHTALEMHGMAMSVLQLTTTGPGRTFSTLTLGSTNLATAALTGLYSKLEEMGKPRLVVGFLYAPNSDGRGLPMAYVAKDQAQLDATRAKLHEAAADVATSATAMIAAELQRSLQELPSDAPQAVICRDTVTVRPALSYMLQPDQPAAIEYLDPIFKDLSEHYDLVLKKVMVFKYRSAKVTSATQHKSDMYSTWAAGYTLDGIQALEQQQADMAKQRQQALAAHHQAAADSITAALNKAPDHTLPSKALINEAYGLHHQGCTGTGFKSYQGYLQGKLPASCVSFKGKVPGRSGPGIIFLSLTTAGAEGYIAANKIVVVEPIQLITPQQPQAAMAAAAAASKAPASPAAAAAAAGWRMGMGGMGGLLAAAATASKAPASPAAAAAAAGWRMGMGGLLAAAAGNTPASPAAAAAGMGLDGPTAAAAAGNVSIMAPIRGAASAPVVATAAARSKVRTRAAAAAAGGPGPSLKSSSKRPAEDVPPDSDSMQPPTKQRAATGSTIIEAQARVAAVTQRLEDLRDEGQPAAGYADDLMGISTKTTAQRQYIRRSVMLQDPSFISVSYQQSGMSMPNNGRSHHPTIFALSQKDAMAFMSAQGMVAIPR